MSGELSMDAAQMPAQGETMLRNEEGAAILRLRDPGWGAKRLAREFGCAHNTVRRYLREGGFAPRACAPCRARTKGKDERGATL